MATTDIQETGDPVRGQGYSGIPGGATRPPTQPSPARGEGFILPPSPLAGEGRGGGTLEVGSDLESPNVQSLASPTPPLRLEDLPKELGVLLTTVGVLGFVLPGMAGTPALIAGGLVLWPKTFGKVENWLQGRFPSTHRTSMQQVGRFLDDLQKRYPAPEKP